MQVTQVEDRVTHAIIGGQNTESFAVAQTAEFFHVLSSTLYSRKKEAMVREIMCNAWDAHIEAGVTDKPIQILLNAETFSIKDFGKGIPPHLIGQVYGTYGGSTKKDNGSVTGGFGLGSKAPFAYVDHFEVTSCHNGIKTIYQMSLSSAVVGGKPSIATIVSVPTEDTGLTVTVNLKNSQDRHEISELVHTIASFGEMQCEINGDLIETIKFSEAKNGYLLLHNSQMPREMTRHSDSVLIRYGNVVYPVQEDDRYSSLYTAAIKFLRTMSHGMSWSHNKDWNLFLIAAPDSISVTPSRESLSMTDHTVATITELLQNFIDHIQNRFEHTVIKESAEIVQSVWLNSRPAALMDMDKLPLDKRYTGSKTRSMRITDIAEASTAYMAMGYPTFEGFMEKDFKTRLDTMIEGGFGHKPSFLALKKIYAKHKNMNSMSMDPVRHIIQPIYRRVERDPRVDTGRFTIFAKTLDKWDCLREPAYLPFHKLRKMSVVQALPLCRGIVVITHNRVDVEDRVNRFPAMKHWFGDYKGIYVYTVARHTKKTQDARDFWRDSGLFVIDLTQRQAWEPADIVQPVASTYVPSPKKVGLPVLSSVLNKDKTGRHSHRHRHRHLNGNMAHENDAPRIKMPEFVVRIPYVNDPWESFKDDRIGGVTSLHIAQLWGDVGGVASTNTQLEKFIKMGAKKVGDFVKGKLLSEFTNNHRYSQDYRWDPVRNPDLRDMFDWQQDNAKAIFQLLRSDPVLRLKFGMPDPLPTFEKRVVKVFDGMDHGFSRRHDPELTALDKLVVSWGYDPKAKALIEKLRASKMLGVISATQTALLLQSEDTFGKQTQAKRQKIRDLILLAMEG